MAPHISAFANADGGTLVIGISDKKRTLEGINSCGYDKINEFINAPKDCCKPMPKYREEFIDITNEAGLPDLLLLLHIDSSINQVIRTSNDRTYLRIGDKSKEMLGENLRNLEYAKGSRHFEDELNQDAWIDALDEALIEDYKSHINASELDTEQVLRARGFIKDKDGKAYLTNAAVLLFAKNVRQFYPNCRVRFIRYEGTETKVGTEINITRDTNIEGSILFIIEEMKKFIPTQLREFTSLDVKSGKFQIVPEYPEFAWLEGIVNAVTHREYAMTGSFIKVSMYDDRLEIESPGGLPNIVTVENIRNTRYSRNPQIARVLTEFGWVRELNEGVKRIYSDMEKFFLEAPEYRDSEYTVHLVLKNNIVARTLRHMDRTVDSVGSEIWEQLDELEKQILTFMMGKGIVSRADIKAYTGKSTRTISNRLRKLVDMEIVIAHGSSHSPNRTYEIHV